MSQQNESLTQASLNADAVTSLLAKVNLTETIAAELAILWDI